MKARNFRIACCLAALTSMPFAAAYAEEDGEKIGGGTTEASDTPVYALDAVVVTANRTPQKITETNADISVVTREEIETMHMQNVEEALRTVPGVQFLSYGASNAQWNAGRVRINGSDDIVVLVDGVRVSDFTGAHTSGGLYAALTSNMNNIERIEVLKGSAGALYGSAAKGGVINIITRKINKTQSVIDISRGAYGRKNYNFNTQGKVDRLSYNAYYGYNLSGNIRDAKGHIWPGKSDFKSMGASLSYDFNDKSKLSFSYNNSKSDFNAYDILTNQNFRDNKYYTNDMTLRHDYIFSDHWNNTLIYRRSRQYSRINYSGIGPWGPYTNLSYSNIGYRFWSDQLTYTSSQHKLVMGFDYSRSDNRYDDPRYAMFDRPKAMSNISTYIQENWKILPKITLSGGFRHDKPSGDKGVEFESHTSKNYKISYTPTEKDTIYGGRSDFYILPSIYQITDEQWGNPALKPSYGRTSSLGYTHIFSDRNSFNINWFYTKSDRTIEYVMGSGGAVLKNLYNDVSRGWNAQWTSQLDQHWSLNLGWSHLFQMSTDDYNLRGFAPKDLATFGIYYHGGKWSGGMDGFYFIRIRNGANEATNWVKGWPSDKYMVVNLSVNYQATPNFGVYAKVENLFNQYWAERSAAAFNGYPYNGEPGQYYSQPGRNLLVGMQYKF